MEDRKAHNVVIFAVTGIVTGILVRRVSKRSTAPNREAIKNNVLHNALYPITVQHTRVRNDVCNMYEIDMPVCTIIREEMIRTLMHP